MSPLFLVTIPAQRIAEYQVTALTSHKVSTCPLIHRFAAIVTVVNTLTMGFTADTVAKALATATTEQMVQIVGSVLWINHFHSFLPLDLLKIQFFLGIQVILQGTNEALLV